MEHILITGAGAGLGREFVKLALADGAKVFAISLLESELDDLRSECASYGDQLVVHQQDLSRPNAAHLVHQWCKDKGVHIDVLINNAGFAVYGDVVDHDLEKVENMMMLNMVTVTKMSALFGIDMKRRGAGHMLNVGSTAGMIPTTRFAVYGASKAYVNAFTVSLREELKDFGVNVCLLTPGPVQTKFAQAATIDAFDGKSRLKNIFDGKRASSPQEIALAGYNGMRRGKAHILAGKGSTFSSLLPRLVPFSLMPRLIRDV